MRNAGLLACALVCLSAAIGGQASDESRRALEKAADKGNAAAMYALGAAAEADGDATGAAEWYLRSAEHGYLASQLKTARCFELGLGVTADPAMAIGWYRAARAQGSQEAADRLRVLAPDDPITLPAIPTRREAAASPEPTPTTAPVAADSPPSLPAASSPPRGSPTPAQDDATALAGCSAMLVLFALGGLIALLVYLLPAIIAFKRGHRNRWLILLLNIFFGFTLIVWIVCLIWAMNRVDAPLRGGTKWGRQDPVL